MTISQQSSLLSNYASLPTFYMDLCKALVGHQKIAPFHRLTIFFLDRNRRLLFKRMPSLRTVWLSFTPPQVYIYIYVTYCMLYPGIRIFFYSNSPFVSHACVRARTHKQRTHVRTFVRTYVCAHVRSLVHTYAHSYVRMSTANSMSACPLTRSYVYM